MSGAYGGARSITPPTAQALFTAGLAMTERYRLRYGQGGECVSGIRMAKKIFISYRRDDVPGDARSIYDGLTRRFGRSRVFMDVDDVLAGQRFDRELERALAQCDVLIAVIGLRWAELLKDKEQSGERDFVHDEIASALERGIVVIPVRVGREERMPPLPRVSDLPRKIRDLVLYQKHDITHERFGRDVEELITAIRVVRKGQGPSLVERIRPLSAPFAPLGRTLVRIGTWPRSAWAIVTNPTEANLAANPLSQLFVTQQWWNGSLCVLGLLVLMPVPNLGWQVFRAYPSNFVLRPAELTVWPSFVSFILSWLVVMACARLFASTRFLSMLLASAYVAGSATAVPNAYLVWLLTIPAGVGKEAGAFSSFELSIPFGLAGVIVFLWLKGKVSLRPLIFIGLFAAFVVLRYYLFGVFGGDGVALPLFLVGLLAYPYILGFSFLRYTLVCAMGAAFYVAWFRLGAMPTIPFPPFMSNAQILFPVYIIPIFTVWIALRVAAAQPSQASATSRIATLSRLITITIVSLVLLTWAALVVGRHFAASSADETPPGSDTASDNSKSSTPARP
jgi:hypothetical protein